MKRNRLNKIIGSLRKRVRMIVLMIFALIILFTSSIVGLAMAIKYQKSYYIYYDEKSNLDYKVYLKKNDYFGEYLEKDHQYIASLIDYIKTDFSYDLEVEENMNFKYYYYIQADVTVLDVNGKDLYSKTDMIVPKKHFNKVEGNSFTINEDVILDYNHYNDIVNNFIKKYKLNYTTSKVELKMYVGIEGECETFSTSLVNDAVISMGIPLTTHTVNIDMNYELSTGENKILECTNDTTLGKRLLAFSIVIGSLAIVGLVFCIRYLVRTRDAKTMYNYKLRSIFKNYGRFITRVKGELNYKKFQIVPVEEFEDLFEVRNCSQSPILYTSDEKKLRSVFIVPTNTGLVYIYYLFAKKPKKETEDEETII